MWNDESENEFKFQQRLQLVGVQRAKRGINGKVQTTTWAHTVIIWLWVIACEMLGQGRRQGKSFTNWMRPKVESHETCEQPLRGSNVEGMVDQVKDTSTIVVTSSPGQSAKFWKMHNNNLNAMKCQFFADANLSEEPTGQQGDIEDFSKKADSKDGHWTNLFLKLWCLAIIPFHVQMPRSILSKVPLTN